MLLLAVALWTLWTPDLDRATLERPVFAVSRRQGASGTGRFCPTLVRPGQQPRARYRAVGIERTIDSQRIALKPFHFIYLLSPLTLWL